MKLGLLAIALLGCGRFSFDEQSDALPSDASMCQGPFRSVATGRSHSCAVDGTGAVWCWGDNSLDAVSLGAPLTVTTPLRVDVPPAVQVVAGRHHSCARLEDGRVFCWGDNLAEQLGAGGVAVTGAPIEVSLGAQRAVDIAAGAWHTCILRDSDRSVVCWGDNRYLTLGVTSPMQTGTPIVIPNTTGTKQISAGHRHSCIVDALDRVQCWGRNQTQQLGAPTPAQRETLAVVPLGPAGDVEVAGGYSCAVEIGGAVRCWGRGDASQLGPGSVVKSQAAPSAPIVSDGRAVEPAGFGACAIRSDNSLGCWGKLAAGDGEHQYTASVRASHAGGVAQLSQPYFHACAIDLSGGVLCWGGNAEAELGRGTQAFSATPLPVAVSGISQVGGNRRHMCASDGSSLYCWGQNTEGQIGLPELEYFDSPVQSPVGLATIDGISANRFHTCAWGGGIGRCVGLNYGGQLGDGTLVDRTTWVAPAGIASITSMAAGLDHSCAIAGGSLYCWGSDATGQLGNGATTTTTQSSPVAVPAIAAPVAIAAGNAHTCAIDGTTVKCWGDNTWGQLGDTTTTQRTAPVSVSLPAAATALSLAELGSCALLTNGDVYCWGYNYDGQLGNGAITNKQTTPVRVQLPAAALSITFAGGGGCARITGGTVDCWGDGTHGELGDGTLRRTLLPEAIASLSPADTVVRYPSGGCVVRGGVLRCWGNREILADGDTSELEPAPPAFPTCRQ